jgi:hypothetical protein
LFNKIALEGLKKDSSQSLDHSPEVVVKCFLLTRIAQEGVKKASAQA